MAMPSSTRKTWEGKVSLVGRIALDGVWMDT